MRLGSKHFFGGQRDKYISKQKKYGKDGENDV